MSKNTTARELVDAAMRLRDAVSDLSFSPPVAYVYNPLEYAWPAHDAYLRQCGAGRKRVVFLGMNPGPWGMAQVGVPFGEVSFVRDWIGIDKPVSHPVPEHPKRVVEGVNCSRSEVSGRRLWGLFADRFGRSDVFFKDHFVANYCPLMFMEESGRNRTPDKLPKAEQRMLTDACDDHLRCVVEILRPDWLVGVGVYALKKAEQALEGVDVRFGRVLHPSPASPAANRGWSAAATRQLVEQGIWS